MLTKFGGLKDAPPPPKCKIISGDKEEIQGCGEMEKSYNADDVFRIHNTDGSNCLDFYEYKCFYQANAEYHGWSTIHKPWKLVRDFDKNENCCLERNEVEQSINNGLKGFKTQR